MINKEYHYENNNPFSRYFFIRLRYAKSRCCAPSERRWKHRNSYFCKHYNSFDLLVTTHKVWINGLIDKTIVQTDTLKSLGSTTQVVDDGFGAAVKRSMRKNYDIYITVK